MIRRIQISLWLVVGFVSAALLLSLLANPDSRGEGPRVSERLGLRAAIFPAVLSDAGVDPTARGTLLEAAPGAITVVDDPIVRGRSAFKLTVDDGDVYPLTPTDNPRAQILSRPVIRAGDEFWLRTRFLLPHGFPAVPGWMSLVSVYGPPFAGASPWQIGIEGNHILWQRNGRSGFDVPWRMPLVRGRWIDVVLHQRFAADGWVEMWIDGRRVTFFPPGAYNPRRLPTTRRLMMATRDPSNDDGPNSAKIMQYRRAGMFDSATVYFGPLLVGASRAAVGA